MTTAQIVILAATFIFILIGLMNHNSKSKWYPITLGLLILSVLMLWVGLLAATLSLNQMKKPCPEYEKIENVYKLKK